MNPTTTAIPGKRIRRAAATLGLATLLLAAAATPSHAAAGHTVDVHFGNGICAAQGGSVTAVQFGSAEALTSVPRKNGNTAAITLKNGSRYATFTGVAWCKKSWWRPAVPSYFSKRVYVNATQRDIRL